MKRADPLEGTAYRAVGHLASGSVAEVLLAEHRELGAPCFVKLLRSELTSDPRFVDRIRFEARLLGRLRHPYVVSVWGAGVTPDGRPFIVTERLKGRTLREELQSRGEPLPAPEAVKYTCQLLSALAAVHDLEVLHCVIHPDHIFVCRELEQDPDEEAFIKLLDLGSARVLPQVARGASTASEGIREDPVDRHADLDAVALVLYEMLSGRGLVDPPEPPSRFARHPVPAELDRLVLQALSKEPHERFQSAREFQYALETLAAASPGEPKAPAVVRYWSLVLVLLVSAAASFGLASYLWPLR